ncbi:MAG: hypothetical protein DMG24_00005, partial [Acidobacteria bacterium]
EYLGEDGPSIPIQVFATDISDKAIAKAREGVFRENITPQVSQARLKRFFTKAEGGYQISKSIRELILFAKHDVTKDPPYSRLDLVCCRNLLIFLGPVLQQRVFAAFLWALKPSGYLMLGTAETVGELSDYFRPVDSRYKIYAKRGSYVPLSLDFLSQRALLEEPAEARPREAAAGAPDLQKQADRVAIEHYSPPGVVVDDDMEIVQFRGHTGSYLDPMPGAASLNLLKIARGDLLFELRSATEKAKRSNAPTAKAGIRIQFNGETRVVNVRVVPLKPRPGGRRYFFVFFEESPPPFSSRKAAESKARRGENGRVRRLEQELKAAKEYLRSAMEDQEATNEELRTANEEVLSANEELQTTNEELETAKEELQSTNEELTTLNEELQNRNAELGQMASDLRNVLNSTFAGIVVVGRDLRIRYFTTQAEKVLNLIPADVGRPVRDIRPSLDIPNLEALIAAVIDEVSNKELTVKGPDGSFYSLRLRPYLTVEKKVDGAVISLIDISERKRAEDAIASSEERFRSLVDAIRDYAIMLLDPEGRVVSSNSGVEDVLGYRADEIEGKHLSCFFPNHSRELADQELAATRAHERYEGEALRVRKDGSQFWAGTLTIALRDHVGNLRGFAKVVQDITSRKEEEDLSRELSIRMMRAQDEERKRISRELHDTAGPSLAALVMNLAQVEKAASGLGRKTRSALAESVKLAKECAQQLRTVSYQLHPPLLDEAGLASALRWYVELLAQRSELKAELELPPNLPRLPKEIEFAVFRVVQEALMNVQRHSGSPTAQVKITCDNHRLALEVRDQGKGIPAEVRDGLGLRGMRERVQQAGGAIEIDSDGDGTAVRVSVPLAELPAPVKE